MTRAKRAMPSFFKFVEFIARLAASVQSTGLSAKVQVMSKPYRNHEEATVESLKKDPTLPADYLNAVLEDGDQAELMLALRRLASPFRGE